MYRDRCRTTNNMLGDAYGAAVVEAMSRKELEMMDSVEETGGKEGVKVGPDEEALIGIYSSKESSNGSSVKVREVSQPSSPNHLSVLKICIFRKS